MDQDAPDQCTPPGPERGARVVAVVVLVVVAAVVGVTLWWSGETAGGGSPRVADTPVVTGDVVALAVVRDWDAARADAWARGDLAALRSLYVPGAVAGRRDVDMLRAWKRRGMRVEGMTMQVLRVDRIRHTPTRLSLQVTDRLVGAVAVGREGRRALPRDEASTRRLVFRRADGVWRLARVRSQDRDPVG